MLYKGPNNPMAVKFNEKPKVALFLERAGFEGFVSISIEGETWIIDEKHARHFKEKKNAS